MEPDEGDGNAVRKIKLSGAGRRWAGVPNGRLATLLFLLDNGDKTTGGTERCQELNTAGAEEVRDALEAVLCHKKHSFKPVVDLIQHRHDVLLNYPLVTLQPGTLAADRAVRKEDEDLLMFVYACRSLEVDSHNLHQKVGRVQAKMDLTHQEMDGSFFIYAENLRLRRLCAALTAGQVAHLAVAAGKVVKTEMLITTEALESTEGLKEVLFFYLMRQLELNDQLNRIYTDRLEKLLQEVGLMEWTTVLGQYPAESRPAGHCVVFCVRKGRSGASGEIAKVRRVFEGHLGYTLTVEEDPTPVILNTTIATLQRPKYRFYDSLVVWVMAHGSRDTFQLADGSHYQRRIIIDNFSRIDNFRKKPKIFFMASCQGRDTISIKHKRGVAVTVDAGHEGSTGFSVVPEHCLNYTAVAYQMDRLVANATLPNHYAFRLSDGGSVYVDTVCRLLESHAGHNLTLVLERVCNKMHQILFSCTDKFQGEAKQSCYYETTFQKTFIVPACVEEQDEKEKVSPVSP